MPSTQTAVMGLIAAAGVALLIPAIISVNTHISHEHCVATTGVPTYTFLSPALNEALCAFNVTFSAAYATPAGKLLVNAFGAFFTAPAFVLLSDYGVYGALVLLLGQAVPISIVYPAFYALAGRPTGPRRNPWLPCLAVLAGYGAPVVGVIRSKMGYGALSLWQMYPVFVLIAWGVLAPLLRNVGGSVREQSVIVGAVVGSVTSGPWMQFVIGLVTGKVSVTEYLGYSAGADFAHAALWVFVVDFIVVAAAALAVAGMGGKPRSTSSLVQCAVVAVVVGPGAAVTWFWVEDA